MKRVKQRSTESVSKAESWSHQAKTLSEIINQPRLRTMCSLLHFLAAVQFYCGVYYQHELQWPSDGFDMTPEEMEVANRIKWGGKFKFLTFLNAILQSVYHTVAWLNDIFGSNEVAMKPSSTLRKFRDWLFAVLAFPFAANVSISFWVIYAYDRELIFPVALDAIFPTWLNHVVHTNVAVLLILDMLICFRCYPRRLHGVATTLAFMLFYIVWIHVVQHNSGLWPYPILEVFNAPIRYTLLCALAVFTALLYIAGEMLNKIIWNRQFQQLKAKRR